MSRSTRFFVLFAAMLMMSSVAFAQFAGYPLAVRLGTLSGGDTFGADYWEDSEAVYTWAGELANYADMATFSFMPGGNGNGFTLNKDEQTFGSYFVGLHMGANDPVNFPGQEFNHLTLGYGYPLEGLNLGFIFNRQSVSVGDDTNLSQNTIGAGIDFDVNEDLNFDAAFNFAMQSGEAAGTDLDLGTGFGFGARAMYGWRDDVTLIPVFGFWTDEFVTDIKNTFFGLGLGFAYTVNDDNQLVFGLDFQNAKTTDDTAGAPIEEQTVTTMPGFSLAVEHEFNDWIEARVGASKAWDKWDADGAEATDFPFTFNVGAGLNVGDWTIDLMINEASFYNFGYWLHGNPSGVAPIAAIQAKLFF